jgi:hypothetical protein
MRGSVPALIGGAMKTASLGVPSSRPMAELPQDDDATHDSDCWRGIVNRAIWFVEDSWQALVGLRPSPGYFHLIRRIEAQLVAADSARRSDGASGCGDWRYSTDQALPDD